ncbi:MAG: XRE family transcriptional regulator [Peptostreptococcaceae bacterium]|jgi:transcriptional regulator with XRE-family HTH domain|nr:XRE family transcriptional regulator [Peptostreptococcaceae bacterium]
MISDIGKKIKELRTSNEMTLKDLSLKTNLSISFLSQLERGLTTIAIDTLETIAKVFDKEISYFFTKENKDIKDKVIKRSYERDDYNIINKNFINYNLSNELKGKDILPRLIEITPMETSEHVKSYEHEGEEFIYILEGRLTLLLDLEEHILNPGDSAHYKSKQPHNWANYTNKTVKFIAISVPNKIDK